MTSLDEDLFEQIIIYNALVNEVYLANISDSLKPEYFKDTNVKAVYSILLEFFTEHGSAPTVTEIKARCSDEACKKAVRAVATSVKNLDKRYNNEELYKNTEKFIKERAVYHTLLSVADEVNNKDVDTSAILDKFEASCNINLNADIGIDYFKDADRHVDDLLKEEKYISSGWPWLDGKLGGGFIQDGRAIYVFAGETNVGKSIVLGNIATNICKQNKTVLLISLEMSEMLYAKRMSANIAKIPINEIQHNTEFLKESLTAFQSRYPDTKLIVKEFPPSTITPQQLGGYIKKVKQAGIHIDTIVIDYINLLKGPEKSNSYEQMKKVTEQVRALSYKFNCPIITATQLNRSGYNEADPGLDTVGESYGMGATADCVLSVWQREEDAELGVINLGMMKNRFGPNFGACIMGIDYSTLTITEEEVSNATDDASGIADTLSILSNS